MKDESRKSTFKTVLLYKPRRFFHVHESEWESGGCPVEVRLGLHAAAWPGQELADGEDEL